MTFVIDWALKNNDLSIPVFIPVFIVKGARDVKLIELSTMVGSDPPTLRMINCVYKQYIHIHTYTYTLIHTL